MIPGYRAALHVRVIYYINLRTHFPRFPGLRDLAGSNHSNPWIVIIKHGRFSFDQYLSNSIGFIGDPVV
jgi:hypothetical protein